MPITTEPEADVQNAEEDLQPVYYEPYGREIANGNRAWVLAFASIFLALMALGFAIYVRLQPPTIIGVRTDGTPVVLGKETRDPVALQFTPGKDEFLNQTFVKRFLSNYLNYSPSDVDLRWSIALNMMIPELRSATKKALTDAKSRDEVEDDQVQSEFHLRELDKVPDGALTYVAYGVKDVRHLVKGNEITDHFVNEYRIRLRADTSRTEANPDGLWVMEYSERPIEDERRDQVLAAPDVDVPHE
jgi:hypothetical protein